MRILLLGAVLITIWLFASAHWYICNIKYLCDEETTEVVETLPPVQPKAEEVLPMDTIKPSIELKRINANHANVHFGVDEIKPSDLYVLDDFTTELVDYLVQNPDGTVTLVGHTDSSGDADYNYRLGLKRAESIGNYFVQSGLDSTKMSISSKGETAPIADNETPEGKALNRRVEVKVTGLEQ
ncbi:OmpA family protein [Flammeovirgaceae bacterium SG7u.111]|nr:OmpA family protein [Flammeovirgaceae bacterium SG7u.132]WPO35005.1 OmpA family protein [Flammeovirgaceae bacterium SG7u.111]